MTSFGKKCPLTNGLDRFHLRRQSVEATKIGQIEEFKYLDQKGLEHTGHFQEVGDLESVYSRLGRETGQEDLAPPEGAKKILDIFDRAKIKAKDLSGEEIERQPMLLIAGGFSRDILQGREPADLDFATDLTWDEVERLLVREFLKEKIESGEYADFEQLLSQKISFFQAQQEYERAIKDSLNGNSIKRNQIPKSKEELKNFFDRKKIQEEGQSTIMDKFNQMEGYRKGKDSLMEDLKSKGIWIDETGGAFQVVRVRFYDSTGKTEEYEIATFRKDGHYADGARPEEVEPVMLPSEDAPRRDLTINGLFYNHRTGKVIDYVGGLNDIREEQLMFAGDASDRINEDHSRLLRFARFFIKTGFNPDSKSVKAVRENAEKIKKVPAEVIRKELDKMLSMTDAGTFLITLDELGLLKYLMPEVKALEQCEQGPPYHLEGNVLKHTEMVGAQLGENASSVANWAVIFHDIAKPETMKRIDVDGVEKVSFIGHDKLGSEKAMEIMRRMRFNSYQIAEIEWLVKNHQKIFNLFRGFESKDSSVNVKGKDKFLEKMYLLAQGPAGKEIDVNKAVRLLRDLISIAKADSAGKISKEKDDFVDRLTELEEEILDFVWINLEKLKQARAKLDGSVFGRLGIKAFKLRRLVLKDLEEAIVRGEIGTDPRGVESYLLNNLKVKLPRYIREAYIKNEKNRQVAASRKNKYDQWNKSKINWENVERYLRDFDL